MFDQSGLDYINYTDAKEPRSYEEAITALDAETWLQTMKCEMDSIHQNQTWDLVELPIGRNPLSCKWVFGTNMYPIQKNPNKKLVLS